MICGRCGMWYSVGDNYCRRCGAAVGANLPAIPAEQRLARIAQSVPPVVWKGLAALAAGKVLEWGAKAAARRVVQAMPAVVSALVHGRAPASGGTIALPPQKRGEANGAGVVAETIVLMRRIRIAGGPGTEGKARGAGDFTGDR